MVVAPGPGEGAPFVPKQLGLKQLGGQRATVQRHKSALAPAHLMRMAGQLLFAGAGFAVDQHRHLQAHGGGHRAQGGLDRRVGGHIVLPANVDATGGGRRFLWKLRRRFWHGNRPARGRHRQGAVRPHHQRAAHRIVQRHGAALLQATGGERERRVEHRLKRGAPRQRQAGQQTAGPLVGRPQVARGIKRHQADAERVQKLGPRVNGQHHRIPHLMDQQQVFDLGGGHFHQRPGVALA